MTRRVKEKREKIQHKKYRGLITQFIIFLVLRSIDLAASIAVLNNAWSHSSDWKTLDETLFNTTNNQPRDFIKPRSINSRRIVPRSINPRWFVPGSFDPRNVDHRNFDHTTFEPPNFGPRNLDRQRSNVRRNDPRNLDPTNSDIPNSYSRKLKPRNFVSPNFDPPNFDPRNTILRRLNPGKTDPRRNVLLNIKRRSINSAQYTSSSVTDYCQQIDQWDKKKVDSNISEYKTILGFTVFFNIVSLSVFVMHLGFWLATLKTTFEDGAEYETRVTRLTRNSFLSLMTALIRDVPLSCLNVELLARRSGREGLACVACIFAGKCEQEDYIDNNLQLAKSLLYLSYFVMLISSFWKGVSGFYRLSRFKEFNIYIIRACASIVFGFLYCIATFTPAMFMFIYRYFAIPGLDAPFLHDLASRLVVLGATIWVMWVSVVVCCPILYAIRLNSD
ncbi:Hypothetical predicted protein [Paramuricea clavata]|uniref:Uncharacterized protein n=1 Tax=Paramuricea clavata TaxID=317549 RepID=A0A7D9IRK8_PARCT|nr:Hypothetical predicted protein [Paramuricea clavata]